MKLRQVKLWDEDALRYTYADLKISLYVCVGIRTMPLKFSILNPINFRVICP